MAHKQVSAFDAGYSNLLDSVRADRKDLEKMLKGIEEGKFLPRLKGDLTRLCESGIKWADRLEAKLEKANEEGKLNEAFVRSFAADYSDFAAKKYEFSVKMEGAKSYSSMVFEGSQVISETRKSLVQRASMYKEKEVKAAFVGLGGDMKLASMVSLSDLFGADLSLNEKALKSLAHAAQAAAMDETVAGRMLWHTQSDIFLKGHPEQFADVLKEAMKGVRGERENLFNASMVVFEKGKVRLDKNGMPIEKKMFDAETGTGKKLGEAYSEVELLLKQASEAVRVREYSRAAKLFKEASESVIGVRNAANKRVAEAMYANAGITLTEWKDVVADAGVLVLGALGSKLGPAAPLAASGYFAVKGSFYVHLGLVTKNDEMVLTGLLMMAPLLLGTASKGMLAVASRGGAGAEALTTGAYSLVLTERAIGAYFTGSMGYNAIHGLTEGRKYGFTPELVKETVQNSVFAAFGLATATGRLSLVKSTLREALEGVGVVGRGIKKGLPSKIEPITKPEMPATAIVEPAKEMAREKAREDGGMRQKAKEEPGGPTLRERARAFARDALRHVGAAIEEVTHGKIAELRSAVDRSALSDADKQNYNQDLDIFEREYNSFVSAADAALSTGDRPLAEYNRGNAASIYRDLLVWEERIIAEGVVVQRRSFDTVRRGADAETADLQKWLFPRPPLTAQETAIITQILTEIGNLTAIEAAKTNSLTTATGLARAALLESRNLTITLRNSLERALDSLEASPNSELLRELNRLFTSPGAGRLSPYDRAANNLNGVTSPTEETKGIVSGFNSTVPTTAASPAGVSPTAISPLSAVDLGRISGELMRDAELRRSRDPVARIMSKLPKFTQSDGKTPLTPEQQLQVIDQLVEDGRINSDMLATPNLLYRFFTKNKTAARDLMAATIAKARWQEGIGREVSETLIGTLNTNKYASLYDAIVGSGNFNESQQLILLRYFYGDPRNAARSGLIDAMLSIHNIPNFAHDFLSPTLRRARGWVSESWLPVVGKKELPALEEILNQAEQGDFALLESFGRWWVRPWTHKPTGESNTVTGWKAWAGYGATRLVALSAYIYWATAGGFWPVPDVAGGAYKHIIKPGFVQVVDTVTGTIEAEREATKRKEIQIETLKTTGVKGLEQYLSTQTPEVVDKVYEIWDGLRSQEGVGNEMSQSFLKELVEGTPSTVADVESISNYLTNLNKKLPPFPHGKERKVSDYKTQLNGLSTYGDRNACTEAIIAMENLSPLVAEKFIRAGKTAQDILNVYSDLSKLPTGAQKQVLSQADVPTMLDRLSQEMMIAAGGKEGALATEIEHPALAATIIHFTPRLGDVSPRDVMATFVAEFERCESNSNFRQLRLELSTNPYIKKVLQLYGKEPYVKGMNVNDVTAWQMAFVTDLVNTYGAVTLELSMYSWMVLSDDKGASLETSVMKGIAKLPKPVQDKFAEWLFTQFSNHGILDPKDGKSEYKQKRNRAVEQYLKLHPNISDLIKGTLPDLELPAS